MSKKMQKFNFRAGLVFGHDVAAAALAWFGAYWIRFNFDLSPATFADIRVTMLCVVSVQVAIFLVMGLYRGVWRYASLPDLKRILLAVGISSLAIPLALLMLRLEALVPRSVLLLSPILLTSMMCGSRITYRAWREHSLSRFTHLRGEPVIILGAGDAGVNLLKELQRNPDWRAVGLLDDNPAKLGRVIHGVKVLGNLDEYPHWAEKLGVKRAILAIPSAPVATKRRLVELCSYVGSEVLTVPSFQDLMLGRVSIEKIRKIEVEDLLGREPVEIDNPRLKSFLTGQVVMVTGAGGSIGSELCRQIANYKPGLLVCFEMSEFALYQINEEFTKLFPSVPVATVIGDVKNRTRVRQILEQYRPTVIFHAAAYKHVPLMEETNAWEAMRNNALGSHVLAQEAVRYAAKTFVLVSTDKAVNPTNVMGGTKRLAEILCQKLQCGSGTRFEIVRFGNVLGSAGSVIPKFHEQIAAGGPITVTHPDIIRYFMSIPEAAQLVLQAGCMGKGGEIFVMDMGEPVKIVDLARQMIHLAGLSKDDIKIVYTGLRPGEKLFEELLADNEQTRPSEHPKLRIAKANHAGSFEFDELVRWLEQTRDLADDEVRRDLKRWVPEYSSTIKPQLKAVKGARLA